MDRRALLIGTLALVASLCRPPFAGVSFEAEAQAAPGLVPTDAAEPSFVFPPPDRSRRRPALGAPEIVRDVEDDDAERAVRVEAHSYSDGAHVLLDGTFELTFPRAARAARAATPSRPVAAIDGLVRIDPPLAARALWLSPHRLFVDLGVQPKAGARFRASLHGVLDAEGRLVADDFAADFVGGVEVQGKVLTYEPRRGAPRPLALLPRSDRDVAPNAELSVLWDQAVDDRAAPLVTLVAGPESGPKTRVAVSFRVREDMVFDGAPVDRRSVTRVVPAAPLKAGERYELVARHAAADREALGVAFGVTGPLAFEKACTDAGADDCFGRTATFESDRTLVLRFTNGLRTPRGSLARHVRVTPAPPSLRITGSRGDEEVRVRADFEPSTRYALDVEGLVDVHGQRLARPVHLDLEIAPVAASVTLPHGVVLLGGSGGLELAARNAAAVEVRAWKVKDDAAALAEALARSKEGDAPTGTPDLRFDVPSRGPRDELTTVALPLAEQLAADQAWLVTARVSRTDYGAHQAPLQGGAKTPLALVLRPGARALAVRASASRGRTQVHVARLLTGEPVAGASVQIGSERGVTDASGAVVLASAREVAVVATKDGDSVTLAPAGASDDDDERPAVQAPALRGAFVLDRDIHRPGSTVHAASFVRRPVDGRLRAAAWLPVVFRLVDPANHEVAKRHAVTDDSGRAAADLVTPEAGAVGRHRLVVETPAGEGIAMAIVQVSEFEAPRFAVDVEAKHAGDRVVATARGRYLFGGDMSGAHVRWRARSVEVDVGASEVFEGLSFEPRGELPSWTRGGDATLDARGRLRVDLKDLPQSARPIAIEFEAEVDDASKRSVAGRARAPLARRDRFAGVGVGTTLVGAGGMATASLGVVDAQGRAVAGTRVEARLVRLTRRLSRSRGPGGSVRREWIESRQEVTRCAAISALAPVECRLRVPRAGDYEVVAAAGGHDGGVATLGAWDGAGEERPLAKGGTLELAAPQGALAPGAKATLTFLNPFPKATLLLTLDDGLTASHRAERVASARGAVTIEIPRTTSDVVSVSGALVPIGARGSEAFEPLAGHARLHVEHARDPLELEVGTRAGTFAPGEEVELVVKARRADAGARADVVVAVVDEAVLRLTGFGARDPSDALHTVSARDVRARDTRRAFADALSVSHVGGDGGSPMGTLTNARREFATTALWRPDLRTDARGEAKVRFRLPQNLGEFRVMAVALDPDGRGATAERALTVTKPLLLAPAVPRFVRAGDSFDAAALVHNTTSEAREIVVRSGGEEERLTVAARGHARVAFARTASVPGTMELGFELLGTSGERLDAVVARVPVRAAGTVEHPRISGAFVGSRNLLLDVPDDATGDAITLVLGEQTFPELGARLGFLLDYPHGCVEQTTSSTLPLLAARHILPSLGLASPGDAELLAKVRVGVARLATMRTPSGGLGYWPQAPEPHLDGTAYALHALVAAQGAGVELPAGLLDGITQYLAKQLVEEDQGPELRATLAASLAATRALPASSADLLWETRGKQGAYGLASLALALASLPNQETRVRELLDSLEAAFEADGEPRRSIEAPGEWDGPERTHAQALIALVDLRPASRLVPVLASALARKVDRYTTHATGLSLLALSRLVARAPDASSEPPRVWLDGEELEVARRLGGSGVELRIPLARVRGDLHTMRLASSGKAAVAYHLAATWTRGSTGEARSADAGSDVHRAYTDAAGRPVDLRHVRAGSVLRVTVVARFDRTRQRRYVALGDRLPAGFEAIQPELASVARLEGDDLPAALGFRDGAPASHVELRDDRASFYFDQAPGRVVVASYLVRATTRGRFSVPPASAELMYEADSESFSEPLEVVVE